MRDGWWVAGFLAVVAVVALLLAHGLAMVVDPVLVWGGYRCETTSGLKTCAGYPPVGLIVAIAIAAFVNGVVRQLVDHAGRVL